MIGNHFVPHVILHLMICRLSLQNMVACTEKAKVFLDEKRKPVYHFVTRDFFSISYKSMDVYKGIFVLCTINSPCAWHQAIAGPFKHKNLNAKLICDFSVCVYFFMQFLWV